MDNLRSVLNIVLSKIPPGEILNESLSYNHITKENFVKLAGYYVKNYSNDELENMFSYLHSEYEEQADYVRGYATRGITEYKESFSVFDVILIFAVRVLQEADGEPVCQYHQLLRWRMTSHELDEEIFTTAYVAFKDAKYINNNRNFSWRPVIRHNNIFLNKILSQGMADNHFHLKGSAPQFPLSWISMMNNVTSKKFRGFLERYSKKRLSTIYYTGTDETHLYISYLKAALIRSYLFSKLMNIEFIIEDSKNEEQVDERLKRAEEEVNGWLRDKDEILFHRNEIQDNIAYFRTLGVGFVKKAKPDYTLNGSYLHIKSAENENYILSGERWFMYAMFQKIYSKEAEFKKYFNMFYAYLVIKITIRSELVQTNDHVGFDNFARYQDRKEDFIEDTPFEKDYIRMAMKGTIKNQRVLALEARITPKSTAKANAEYIRKVDSFLKDDETLKNRSFYVFHFIKEKDNPESMASDIICRHYRKRQQLRKQAQAIARFRELYPHEATRLKGIDACAKEIGCRPEVFAQVYRYLGNHTIYHRGNEIWDDARVNTPEETEQLSMTYHIGEDYLDIVDSLRAIDEAINFLRLDCGSRFGHALGLGINVEEYYEIKRYKLLISQQDYLDNLVWIYYRIKKFGLENYQDLLVFIEQEYNKYFRLIYGNYICDGFFNEVMKEAKEYFRDKEKTIVEGYCNSHFYFRISEYYASWKLRGDNPLCYINGYFKELDDISEWNRYSINREYPKDYRIRYNPECAYLYYLYHFCGNAKREGEKVIEINISHQMMRCVKEIQREMRIWVGKKGIGIETNPSSNYLIGTFKRYDRHPIFDFYNLGLVSDPRELGECPQLPVCINTDDQGVFSTYLENEYALLALALEKTKDENGQNKYNRMLIYQWIDNVRKLGLYLSFGNTNRNPMHSPIENSTEFL